MRYTSTAAPFGLQHSLPLPSVPSFSQILKEVEAKAPILEGQRRDYQSALASYEVALSPPTHHSPTLPTTPYPLNHPTNHHGWTHPPAQRYRGMVSL